jgi:hypothetical protein
MSSRFLGKDPSRYFDLEGPSRNTASDVYVVSLILPVAICESHQKAYCSSFDEQENGVSKRHKLDNEGCVMHEGSTASLERFLGQIVIQSSGVGVDYVMHRNQSRHSYHLLGRLCYHLSFIRASGLYLAFWTIILFSLYPWSDEVTECDTLERVSLC